VWPIRESNVTIMCDWAHTWGRSVKSRERGASSSLTLRKRVIGFVNANAAAPALFLTTLVFLTVVVLLSPMRHFLESIIIAQQEAVLSSLQAEGESPPEPMQSRVDLLTVVYANLQLFTLNSPPLDIVPVPRTIQWARILAPAFGVFAVVIGLSRVMRAAIRSLWVSRWYGHEVLCLSEDDARTLGVEERQQSWMSIIVTALRLDVNRSGRELLLLRHLDDDLRNHLLRAGRRPIIAPFADSRKGALANAVSGAARVHIDLGDDVETLHYARAAAGVYRTDQDDAGQRSNGKSRLSRRAPEAVIAVISDPVFEGIPHGVPNLRVQTRNRRLQYGVVNAAPPHRRGDGALHLAIIGDGPYLADLVRGIRSVIEPGEVPKVTLIVPTESEPLVRSMFPDPPDVVIKPVAPDRLVDEVRKLQAALSKSRIEEGKGPELGSPLILHVRGPIALLIAAQLRAAADLPKPTIVVPSESLDRLVNLSERKTTAANSQKYGGGDIRVVGANEVSSMTLLDGFGYERLILDVLDRDIREWSHTELRGPHPAAVVISEQAEALRDGRGQSGLDRWFAERLLGAFSACGLLPTVAEDDDFPLVLWTGDVAAVLGGAASSDSYKNLQWRAAVVDLVAIMPRLVAPIGLKFRAEFPRLALTVTQIDRMAEEIHRQYLAALSPEERSRRRDSHESWESLNDIYRESNRAQARRVFNKLAILNLWPRMVESGEVEIDRGWPEGFTLSDSMIASLARYEHEHWCGYLLDRGYRFAADTKDVSKLLHSNLVPFDELNDPNDPDAKQKDRNTVTSIPSVLAAAGLKIEVPDHIRV
jgi:hypothetical protein